MRAALFLLLLPCLVAAAEPLAELGFWPALIQADEEHRLAVRLRASAAGVAVLGWAGADALAVSVPEGDSTAQLALPYGIGLHRGEARLGDGSARLAIRLSEVAGPWPITALRDGLPVDAAGVPVVLVERRRSANDVRRERLAPLARPRPDGRPIVVGDPLATPGGDAWSGLAAELRPALDERYPQHAALLALAALDRPRSILWCPGNGALFAGTWAEEGRLCAALAHRCAALAIRPRLVLALPPWPVTAAARELAGQRRQALAAAAQAAGWELLDLAASAGDPALANRLSPGLFAEYPVGAAQQRLRTALGDELAR